MMAKEIDLNEVNKRVQIIEKAAMELKQMGDHFPALSRNVSRILANIKMLEINIADVLDAD